MSLSLGDLKITVILDILNADKNAKQYTTTLKNIEAQSDKTAASGIRLSDKIQNIGLRFQGLQAIVSVLKSSFGDMINSYNQQEVALAKLTNGLKNVGEGAAGLKKLTDQASDLQKTTPFADEEINNAQAMLTTFQKSSEQIEILTPRMLDLAAAYSKSGESGMDLQQVAVLLGKVNEETIGGLRRVGVAFTKEQEEKLKSLEGTEQTIYLSKILDSNFKGLAQTIGDTAAGKMVIFRNQVGELKEAWGKLLVDVLLPILTPLKDFVLLLQNSPPGIKSATLALTGLGIAFVFLNGNMPGPLKAFGILLPVILALPDPLRELAIVIVSTAGVIKLLGGDIGTVTGLIGNLIKSFPGLGSAATSAGSVIARVFSTGGPIVVAIGIAIYWVNELMNKISDAQKEAKQLENYQKKVREGSFIPSYDENAAGNEVIGKYKKILDKDPEKEITVDGKTLKLKDYVVQLENAQVKTNQFGKTWEEMSNQVNSTIKDQKRSSVELGVQIDNLNKQLGGLKPDDSSLSKIKSQRDSLLAQKKIVDDLIAPPEDKSGSSGKTPKVKKVKEFISVLDDLKNKLEEVKERISNQSLNESESEGLFFQEKDLEIAIDYVNNLQKYKEVISGIATVGKNITLEGLTSIADNVQSGARGIAPDETIIPAEKEDTAGKINAGFKKSLALAQQLAGVLGFGADSFVSKFLSGIQEGLSLANSFASLFSAIAGVGSGGIFSLLGLAGGGHVPGSGSGDTVPAMLTPGEFVINKSRASQLGTGFLTWLNGGGLLTSVAGHYASGGMVTAGAGGGVVHVPFIVNGKIEGSDIRLSLARVNKTEGRRNL